MNDSQLIDKQISELPDWRGETYSLIRKIIHEVDPLIEEHFKWGTGVFAHDGNVCAIGVFKDHVKINFFQGASLRDSNNLFNSGLDAKKMRAIDFFINDKINERALKELIKIAVDFNSN